MSLPTAESGNEMILNVPPNPKHSGTLWITWAIILELKGTEKDSFLLHSDLLTQTSHFNAHTEHECPPPPPQKIDLIPSFLRPQKSNTKKVIQVFLVPSILPDSHHIPYFHNPEREQKQRCVSQCPRRKPPRLNDKSPKTLEVKTISSAAGSWVLL